jgi:broad specificity phosphatase PhoE
MPFFTPSPPMANTCDVCTECFTGLNLVEEKELVRPGGGLHTLAIKCAEHHLLDGGHSKQWRFAWDEPKPKPKPGLVVVMRHWQRTDCPDAAPWHDRTERPYDPPIVMSDSSPEKEARTIATMARAAGYSKFLVVVSPFRRCVQTASLVIEALGGAVEKVRVDVQFGELMSKIETPDFSYMSDEEMYGELTSKIQTPDFGYVLERAIPDPAPSRSESDPSGYERYQRAIRGAFVENVCVVVVTHGDAVAAAGNMLRDDHVTYDTRVCSWIAITKGNAGSGFALVKHNRLQRNRFE